MQKYKQLDPTEPLRNSIPSMQESLDSAASNFSGTAFPTENLFVGMHCVRTDLNTEYVCTAINDGAATWQDVAKLTLHAGQAETDGDGNNIAKTYLKKTDASDTYLTKTTAAGTYLKKTDAASTYYPKESGEALADDVASNVQAVKDLQNNVSEDISTIKEDISSLQSDVGSIDVSANKFTVTASTQAERVIYGSGANTSDSSASSGSGNQSNVRYEFKANSGEIPAGTYTLKDLLQKLVNAAHHHTIRKFTTFHNCNCNCDCNCDNTC